MFIKGSGISFCYDEWVHLLALIPANNRERRWEDYIVPNIMSFDAYADFYYISVDFVIVLLF